MQKNPNNIPQVAILGKIGRSYGIYGWCHIISHTEPPTNIFNYSSWCIQIKNQWQVFEVEAHKLHGTKLIAKLKGIDTPEDIKKYANFLIGVDRRNLPQLKEAEYYWDDLIGLNVKNLQEVLLGKVTHLMNSPNNDILVVEGDRKRLIPYTSDVICSINLEKKEILVDWDASF